MNAPTRVTTMPIKNSVHSSLQVHDLGQRSLLLLLPLVLVIGSGCSNASAEKPAAAPVSDKGGEAQAGSKSKVHRIAVETHAVERASFEQRLTLSGLFKPVRTTRVAVEVPGRVIDLRAKEGERVEASAIIVRQDATMARAQLSQADAAVAQADAGVDMARNQLRRSEKLARSKVLDQARLDAARLTYKQAVAGRGVAAAARKIAKASLAKLIVRAPMSGTVTQRGIEIGEIASPGMPLVTISDYSTVKLIAEVPERNIGRLKVGDKVPLTVPALGDKAFEGTVSLLPMQADARTRTYDVEILVDNDKGQLRGGMSARLSLLLDRRQEQVVIPLHAVIDEPTATLSKITSVVFVVKDGRAHRVEVTTGAMQARTVLIEKGLTGSEQLIVVGQRRVVDGDAVRVSKKER
ncbi:MAG: efflux RND transporter periplasmic adaptor subunit [Myxococcales bacterium]|nr:efflux RND transporter periplasmic adaptor subunit [Myxococcales bacterium]